MLGSDIIDIAIGMSLIFLMASLICTAIREALEGILKMRAMDLERGVRELLNDPSGSTITKALYDHPLIYSLFAGKYDPANLKKSFFGGPDTRHVKFLERRNLPSYIPAGNFASALIDILGRGGMAKAIVRQTPSIAQLRNAVSNLPNIKLRRAVVVAIDQAEGDIAKVKTNLETYFNSSMDRVSGWYKRRTQLILFFVGIVMAGSMNIDAMYVADRLGQDKALRQAVVSQAQKLVPDDKTANSGAALKKLQEESFNQLRGQLVTIGLPVGWSWPPAQYTNCYKATATVVPGSEQAGCKNDEYKTAAYMALGWLITAFAVMLGAPFWFDALNKLMVIRGTVKPNEKSPPEGSKDAQPAAANAAPAVRAAAVRRIGGRKKRR